jgi:hypothetical protein
MRGTSCWVTSTRLSNAGSTDTENLCGVWIKTLYKKTEWENADNNILTKQYFPRAYTEEKRELDTGLIVVRANCGQQFGGRERYQQTRWPWRFF